MIATAVAALTLSMAGCASTDGPSTGPSATASSGSDGATATDGPSFEAPSDWQVAAIDSAQLQVPADWSLTSTRASSQTLKAPKDSLGVSSQGTGIFQDNKYAGGVGSKAIDELAQLRERSLSKEFENVKRLPNETINGSEFYHFQSETETDWQDHYGTVVPDGSKQVTVYWYFKKVLLEREDAEKMIGTIMPTYKVR